MEIDSFLNPLYIAPEFSQQANKFFASKSQGHINEIADYNSYPFSHLILKNFISDTSFLKDLKGELDVLEYAQKNCDLYKFNQSKDLKSVTSPNIDKLKSILYKDFKNIIEGITNIHLNEDIDMFAAKYTYNDVLLCHDDQSEGRRLAFIYYLNPETWQEADGGLLGLFALNDQNEPDFVSTQILPTWNQLVLFEVSDKSYHQVSELKTPNKSRLTISGWFHGEKPLLLHLPSIYFPLELIQPLFFEENAVYDWINPSYLSEETIFQIQSKFCETSEINLCQFLNEDKYAQLLNALDTLPEKCWEVKGPKFRRSYLVVNSTLINLPTKKDANDYNRSNAVSIDGQDNENKPSPFDNPNKKVTSNSDSSQDCLGLNLIRDCGRLFGSEALFLILSNMTGLDLHPLASPPTISEPNTDSNQQFENGINGTTFGSSNTTKRKESMERKRPRKEDSAERDIKPSSASTVDASHTSDDSRPQGIVEEASESSNHGDEHHPIQAQTSSELGAEPPTTDASTKSEVPKDPSDYGTRFQFEIRKFRAGDYTLLNDTSNELTQKSLNLCLYLGCEDWDPEYGGQMVYVDPEEEDPLLTINPFPNSVALVYNDEGLAHFVKYINNKCTQRKVKQQTIEGVTASQVANPAQDRAFYQLFFNYFESPETRCD